MTLFRYSFPQISNKGGLASHCHGDFTIAREKYLVKEIKIRKGRKGRNDSQCLFFLLLAFVFYKKLYSLGIVSSSPSSFIDAY